MVRDTAPTGETIEELRDRIERAREQIARVELDRGQLLSRIEELESRAGVLATQVERALRAGQDLTVLHTGPARLERHVEDQGREIERLKKELHGRDEYIKRLRARIETTERALETGETRSDEIADLTDERDQLAQEVDQLRATLAEREGRIAEIQDELTAVWDEWDKKDREVQALTEQLIEKQARVNELDNYVQTANDELDRLSEESQSLQREMARVRQQLDEERSVRQSAVEQADREARRAGQLADTVRALERQLVEYREKLANAPAVASLEPVGGERVHALEHENARLRREIEQLVERERQIGEALRTARPILEAFRILADLAAGQPAETAISVSASIERDDNSGVTRDGANQDEADRGPSGTVSLRAVSATSDGGETAIPTVAAREPAAHDTPRADGAVSTNDVESAPQPDPQRAAPTDGSNKKAAETLPGQPTGDSGASAGDRPVDPRPDEEVERASETGETDVSETERAPTQQYDRTRRDLLLATWLIVPPSSFIANDLARQIERRLHLERPLLVLAEVLRRMPESQRRSRNQSFYRGTVLERARSLSRNRGKPITASLPSEVVEGTGPIIAGDWRFEATGIHVEPVEDARTAVLHLRVQLQANSRKAGAPLDVVLFAIDRVFHWSPLASVRYAGACPSSCVGPVTVLDLPPDRFIEGHLVFPLSEAVTPTHYGLIDGDRLEIRRLSPEHEADPTPPTT